jgi:glycosyltransferase involved in cell wall biosynthesis
LEVVYVDNNSTDGTREELARLLADRPRFRAFREEQQGSSFARNRGAEEARGRWVWYLDDDSLPRPQALQAYLKALPVFDSQLATGPIIPIANTPVPWWFDINAKQLSNYLARCDFGSETRILERGHAWGPNLVVRKDAFIAAGGFNKKLGVFGEGRGGGEESELQNRMIAAGARLLYVHEAAVEHLVLPKQMIFTNYLKQRYHRGISEARELTLRGRRVAGFLPTALKIGGHAGTSLLAAATGRTASAVDHIGACVGLYGMWSVGRKLTSEG